MKCTIVQTNLYWEDKQANLQHFTTLLNDIKEQTDLIVLPEMFTTGFSMNTSIAETPDGDAIKWMLHMAQQKNAVICGSLMMHEHFGYVNRFVWAAPDGTIQYYDKQHLFRMGEENNHYSRGSQRIIISYKEFRIMPVVCYDIRFPVSLYRTKQFDYDMILVVANWPERRSHHWKALLQARAIENQCYVIAVNRIGDDGNGVQHSGDSHVISPKGEIIFEQHKEACVKTIPVQLQEVEQWRNAFPVIEDADSFTLG